MRQVRVVIFSKPATDSTPAEEFLYLTQEMEADNDDFCEPGFHLDDDFRIEVPRENMSSLPMETELHAKH